jgi:hypothetical protein
LAFIPADASADVMPKAPVSAEVTDGWLKNVALGVDVSDPVALCAAAPRTAIPSAAPATPPDAPVASDLDRRGGNPADSPHPGTLDQLPFVDTDLLVQISPTESERIDVSGLPGRRTHTGPYVVVQCGRGVRW